MRAIAGANKDRESSHPATNTAARVTDTDAAMASQAPQPSQQRSQSGQKFTNQYTQQLKKQVQQSSQANNIDPLATKQYLQNYLSEHNPTMGGKTQGSPVKMPIKVIKKVQQAIVAGVNPPGSNNKNYSSNSGQIHKADQTDMEPNQHKQGSKPPSRHQTRHDRNSNATNSQNTRNIGEPLNSGNGGEMSQTFDRRKDRALSSSTKQKFAQTSSDNILGGAPASGAQGQASRSLVRPSSKNRGSSQQAQTQKIVQQPTQKTSSSQPRGQSPKINQQQPQSTTNIKLSGPSQLNMSNQNLQSYFENQNQQQYGAGSSKNLPRKKRITVQQQQQQNSLNTQSTSQQVINKTDPNVSSNIARQPSRTGATGGASANNNQPMPNNVSVPRAASPTTAVFGEKPNEVKRPASRSTSNNNRPHGADHGPQPFEKEELFLNVDSQYNELILQMIQPNRSHFDFEGSVQYVMNASELSNQALARLIFSRKNIPLPKVPDQLQFKAPGGPQRSRNQGGLSTFGKNGAAGQSTSSFFNTKKSFMAATHSQASSGLLNNAIKRPEGYHDGPDPNAIIGKDFHPMIRTEIRSSAPDAIKQLMPDYQSAKYSAKRNGIVAAYGANTNQGIVRNYNEDRVAIILNIMKPKSKQFSGAEWPKCSFFGIYDGHGGHVCADFLRDYLHQFIIKDQYFPKEPIKAIKNGFKEAEKLFLEFAEGQQSEVGDIDRSGSCAIVALIIDDMCYIGNTGDSRACMSADGGRQVVGLSTDHKPTEEVEMHRILNKGGRIYQNASIVNVQQPTGGLQSQIVLGPHRVFPGRLSVCRTFGDIEAKLERLEGNDRVVIADPDVTAFRIDRDNHDFIVIGCDGIFDKLENRDCVHLVWQACLMDNLGSESLVNPNDEEQVNGQKQGKTQDERRHKIAGLAVDSILKACAMRRSCDNITAVVIGFDNFYRKLDQVKRGARPQQVTTANDHEVIEEIQMQPVSESPVDNNVIYIESDDHQESVTDDANDYELGKLATVTNSEAPRGLRNSDSSPFQYGETGTTQTAAGGAQSQAAAMTMVQMQSPGASMDVVGKNGSSYTGIPSNKTDKILSEIAEEDSISMISDRPRRFKPSDCVTPADPVTNSFMAAHNNAKDAHSRLKDTSLANRLHAQQVSNFVQSQQATTHVPVNPVVSNNNIRTPNKTAGQLTNNPYDEQQQTKSKNALVGSGAAMIQQKPTSYKNGEKSSSSQNEMSAQGSDSLKHKNHRPPSSTKQKRSSSGQGSRVQVNQGSSLHSLIEQTTGQVRSRQSKNLGYDKAVSQTMPALNNRETGVPSSAYGNIIGSYTNATTTSSVQSGNIQGQKTSSHSQSALAQISAQQIHPSQPLLHHQMVANQHQNINSQSQQLMPSLSEAAAASGQNSTSAAVLYQVGGGGPSNNNNNKRRSSNQSHQRNQYGNSGNKSQNSITQSQGSMPPTSNSASLLPVQPSHGTGNIQLSGSKGFSGGSRSQTKHKSADTGKSKAKTQQPNKLSELFRQVDSNGQVINPQANVANAANNHPGAVTNNSSQFVPKGSLSVSNNQMLVRTMQMQNNNNASNIANGAQVHNIQIKPISANKRRAAAGPQNLIQASFISGSQQQQQPSQNDIIVGRTIKDKTQFSQTSIIKQQNSSSVTEFNVNSKQPQKKLISQYLAQVNQSSTQQLQPQQQQPAIVGNNGQQAQSSYGQGGAYASRSTRKSDKSPGVLSRANRVQMTYNQSLPQSKVLMSQTQSQLQQPISAQGSRNTSSGNQQKHGSSSALANNAYTQLPPSGPGQKKGDSRSRNSNHVTGSNTVNMHGLPKWQSLNNVMNSGAASVHGGSQQHSQTQQNIAMDINNLSYSAASQQHQQASKKRKSTNV